MFLVLIGCEYRMSGIWKDFYYWNGRSGRTILVLGKTGCGKTTFF